MKTTKRDTMKRYFAMTAMVAAFGSGLSTQVVAADSAPPAPDGQKSGWQDISPEKMREHMAKRQAALHDQLKLTPAQEPAWKTYLAAMVPPPMSKVEHDPAMMEKMTAPERMEKMLEMTKSRETLIMSHLAALKTFYAVLTPSQQQVFDQQTRPGRNRAVPPPRGAAEAHTKG